MQRRTIWELQCPSVLNCAFHQVFIECMKDQLEDVHPLVLKVAGKSHLVAIGGMQADVKFVVNQLCDSEKCGGWQYDMTFFLDQQCGHPVYRFEERTICFCVPNKFPVKALKIFICDQGA